MAKSSTRRVARHGFGYDPHFFLPSLNASAAELDPAVKNASSHRAIALRQLLARLDGGSVIPIKPAPADIGNGVIKAFTSPGSIRLTSLPPLALYVHFPWCVRKCPYCDFNSHEWKGDTFPEDRLSRRIARRSRTGAAARLGTSGAYGVHWRRHAEPAVGGGARPHAVRRARAAAARRRRRNHARSQPRHVRSRRSSRSFARAA